MAAPKSSGTDTSAEFLDVDAEFSKKVEVVSASLRTFLEAAKAIQTKLRSGMSAIESVSNLSFENVFQNGFQTWTQTLGSMTAGFLPLVNEIAKLHIDDPKRKAFNLLLATRKPGQVRYVEGVPMKRLASFFNDARRYKDAIEAASRSLQHGPDPFVMALHDLHRANVRFHESRKNAGPELKRFQENMKYLNKFLIAISSLPSCIKEVVQRMQRSPVEDVTSKMESIRDQIWGKVVTGASVGLRSVRKNAGPALQKASEMGGKVLQSSTKASLMLAKKAADTLSSTYDSMAMLKREHAISRKLAHEEEELRRRGLLDEYEDFSDGDEADEFLRKHEIRGGSKCVATLGDNSNVFMGSFEARELRRLIMEAETPDEMTLIADSLAKR